MYSFTVDQTLIYVKAVFVYFLIISYVLWLYLSAFVCAIIISFLKVAYQNDGEAALIQFASPDEAKRAIQSTEAVLNNRFIRVHWFREEASDGQLHPHSQLQPRTQPATVMTFFVVLVTVSLPFSIVFYQGVCKLYVM